MKKYAALFLSALIFCMSGSFCVSAQNDTAQSDIAEFDDASVLVTIRPRSDVRTISSASLFDGLGIAEIKNLDGNTGTISTFALSPQEQTLKLTLDEPGEENVLEVIEKLKQMPDVVYAEPNYIFRLAELPNDTYYTSNGQYALDKINAPAVWDMNIDCSGVAVAVIDTGTMITHPDLADNIWTNPGEINGIDGVDDDGNGYVDDIHGWNCGDWNNAPTDVDIGQSHGTHVSGIVSAATNNDRGVASLARNAKIVPLRIYDQYGYGMSEYIIEAINYVKIMDIPIVNNSYVLTRITENSEIIRNKIKGCTNSLFVAGAGNDGTNNDEKPIYPASYDLDNLICVASTDENDNLSVFGNGQASNFGVISVDIAAPGSGIMSTIMMANGEAGYGYLSGTSMACPMVTSAAAVIKAKYPDITPAEIIKRLELGADAVDGLNGKVKTGARLNAYKSLLPYAESVSLNKTAAAIGIGDTLALAAAVYPENTIDLAVWESSDTSVATVDNGIVTAVKPGTATITVAYENAKASCAVTVSELPKADAEWQKDYDDSSLADAVTGASLWMATLNATELSYDTVNVTVTDTDNKTGIGSETLGGTVLTNANITVYVAVPRLQEAIKSVVVEAVNSAVGN